jgi:hypothetical protein
MAICDNYKFKLASGPYFVRVVFAFESFLYPLTVVPRCFSC